MHLAEGARLLGEDDGELIFSFDEQMAHIKSMRAERIGKRTDFLPVEQDDAGAIQSVKA